MHTAKPKLGERVDSICGTLYTPDTVIPEACVTISGDRIEGITETPRGDSILDYRGTNTAIIPGIIDLHVHLRGLELSYKEDEQTGTLEAAGAGITMVVDMPNTRPRLDTPASLALKLEALAEHSVVDYGVYAAIPRDLGIVEKLAGKPIAGFKIYPSDYQNQASIVRAAGTGRLVVVHPELPEAEAPVQVEDLESRSAHRGCHWEAASIPYLAPLLEGVRVHATHVSCESTLREAEKHGWSIDVAPHHLLYTVEGARGCLYRVNPPLRQSGEPFRLLNAILEGRVDALASDHAPHAVWEKSEPLSCSPGFPWLGLWPWAAYRLLRSVGLGPSSLARLASQGPARILGLDHLLGGLEPGMRANITVFRDEPWRYPGPRWHKHRWPVHFMLPLRGVPAATIVGGRIAYLEGRGAHQGPLGRNVLALEG